MVSQEIPSNPQEVIDRDIFEIKDEHFLCIVDYLINFP